MFSADIEIWQNGTAMAATERVSDINLITDIPQPPSRASYGVYVVITLEKTDRITTTPHYILKSMYNSLYSGEADMIMID